MLKSMRQSVNSPFIKLLLVVLVLSFVSFYGFNQVRSGCSGNIVAEVNGEAISIEEYVSALKNTFEYYKQLNKYMGGMDENQLMQMAKEQALTNLINMRLRIQEAHKLGLQVSDDELSDYIKNIQVFTDPSTKKFSQQRYQLIIRNAGMTIEQFEESQRKSLLSEKLDDFIKSTAKVTEDEVLEDYKIKNESINLSYIKIEPASFKKKITNVKEDELKKFFNDNKNLFLESPERKFEYLELNIDNFINATNDELETYYNDIFLKNNKDALGKLKEVRVRASHILLKTGKNESDDNLKNRANDILKKIKAGASFELLASQYNDDSTKFTGGDLGYFTKGKMVKEFEEAAFEMKIGEIRGPIKTQFGYHIIKLTDIIPQGDVSLERLKNEIQSDYLKAKKMDPEKSKPATEEMKNILSEIKAKSQESPEKSLKDLKKSDNLRYGETGFLAAKGNISGIMDSTQLIRAAFELLPKETSDPIFGFFTKTGYIVRLINVKDPQPPKYEDVKDKVEKEYKEKKVLEIAKDESERILKESVSKPDQMNKIASKNGLSITETGKFKRTSDSRIPVLGKSPEIVTEAFKLSDQNPLINKVITVDKNYYIVKLKERIEADLDKFNKDKESLLKLALDQKKNEIIKQWMENAQRQAKIEKFEIKEDMLM